MSNYEKLKRKVDEYRAAVERAAGARDQLVETLKREFEVGSIEEAKKLLTKVSAQAERAEQEYQKELTAFEAQWEGVL